jgi:hypothetical protein
VTVKTGGLFSNVPTLKVEGESDIWCAGAVEAVMAVVLRNRLWYWWLIRLPITPLFLLAALAPTLHNWFMSKELKVSVPLAMIWASFVLTLGFISFTSEKLLPTAALVFTNDLGFVRRYGAELGLALGVISLLASLLMWLYPVAA